MCEKDPPEHFFLHFCGQILRTILNLTINFIYIAGKIFSDFSYHFFPKINTFLLKKSYFLWKIPPFNYPGTLRVIEPESEPGPGNGKFQKTGSGLGTPLLVMAGYPVRCIYE